MNLYKKLLSSIFIMVLFVDVSLIAQEKIEISELNKTEFQEIENNDFLHGMNIPKISKVEMSVYPDILIDIMSILAHGVKYSWKM